VFVRCVWRVRATLCKTSCLRLCSDFRRLYSSASSVVGKGLFFSSITAESAPLRSRETLVSCCQSVLMTVLCSFHVSMHVCVCVCVCALPQRPPRPIASRLCAVSCRRSSSASSVIAKGLCYLSTTSPDENLRSRETSATCF
jgi:hypothetical protein